MSRITWALYYMNAKVAESPTPMTITGDGFTQAAEVDFASGVEVQVIGAETVAREIEALLPRPKLWQALEGQAEPPRPDEIMTADTARATVLLAHAGVENRVSVILQVVIASARGTPTLAAPVCAIGELIAQAALEEGG